MPIILENIIAEDRIDKIRIVNENDDVIGGQPELEGMSENDNNGLLDIACTLKKAQKDIEASNKTLNTALDEIINQLPISPQYSTTRKYEAGDIVKISGVYYECYHPDGALNKDPLDAKNRPSGWESADEHAPYYWIKIGRSLALPEIGAPIPIPALTLREGLIKYRNDNKLSAQKFWRLAELYPNLVKNGFIEIADLRANVIRGLDDGRGVDTNRVINSYQEDAMQKISGSFQVRTHQGEGLVNIHGDAALFKQKYNAGELWVGQTANVKNANNDKNTLIYFDSSLVARANAQDETVMKNIAMLYACRI